MTSFNDLSQELVDKVVELSVEKVTSLFKIAIESKKEILRKKILLNLCLIAKRFVVPSQKLLWKYVGCTDPSVRHAADTNAAFIRSIREGLGKNMIIEDLRFSLGRRSDFKTQVEELVEILKGVKSVKFLSIINTISTYENPDNEWPAIFSIPSLQGLTKLDLWNINLSPLEVSLPSTLKHVVIWDSISARSFLSLLPLPSAIIERIDFLEHSGHPYNRDIGPLLVNYFKSHGTNLKRLHFDHNVLPMIPILLPFTPSLLYLSISSRRDSVADVITYVKFLPLTTKLETLNAGTFSMGQCSEPNFLAPLLILPQLSNLKILRFYPDETTYDYISDTEYEEDELEEKVLEVVYPAIDYCTSKGVDLVLKSELGELLEEEREKNFIDKYIRGNGEFDSDL